MSGSVKQDKARGTWYFVADLRSADGKRRQYRRRGFKTKKAATEALATFIADQARGTFHRTSKVTLSQFLLDEWLPAKRSTLRPSTAAAYEQIIRTYVGPRMGATSLAEIDGAMLNALYGTLLTDGRTETRRHLGPGLSSKTVRNIHGVLTKAFHDAVRWNRILRNPCHAADPPKGGSPEMKAWSGKQLGDFIRSVADHRWVAIWTLMATTGLRRGEALGLRWTDVDLTTGKITIRSTRIRFGQTVDTSTPKTAKGNRTISISPSTVTGLRAWRSAQATERLLIGGGWLDTEGLVITNADGSAPNPEAFSNLFRTLSKRAGLPLIRLHDLRHSYATAALASGVPVKVLSQRLGHADIAITLKTYAHVMPGDDEDAARRADVVLGLG
jgi:integrase